MWHFMYLGVEKERTDIPDLKMANNFFTVIS